MMDDLINESTDRRMLVYLLLDTSTSMSGAPIQAVREGVEFLSRELRTSPEAVELVHLSVISFSSSARVLVPLTPLMHFQPPQLTASGGTNMAAALNELNASLNREFRPNRSGEVKGDYKPLVFLLTDGEPNDLQAAIAAADVLKSRPSGHTIGTFLALGCGSHVNAGNLQRIAPSVALMADMNADNIQSFFKWVTASIGQASRVASAAAGGEGTGQMRMEAPEIPVNSEGKQAFKFEF